MSSISPSTSCYRVVFHCLVYMYMYVKLVPIIKKKDKGSFFGGFFFLLFCQIVIFWEGCNALNTKIIQIDARFFRTKLFPIQMSTTISCWHILCPKTSNHNNHREINTQCISWRVSWSLTHESEIVTNECWFIN